MVFKQEQPWNSSTEAANEAQRLPTTVLDPSRVAVLLNRNARRVNKALARDVERRVGREHFFYSNSLEEAEAYTREIVQRGYGTVVCGGGDGTLMRTYNLVQRYVDESNAWRRERHRRYGEVQAQLQMPRFAFLALGTGNGLRHVVGAERPLEDLRKIIEDVPTETHALSTIEARGERFCFGGLGYDSLLLNDYNWLRQQVHTKVARALVQTVGGYFAAMATRTLPNVLRNSKPLQARVVTRADAFFVDPQQGDKLQAVPAGTVLSEGPITMLGMGTTPFFGYGFRIFPFASLLPGMMHLRIAQLGPLTTLAHLPSLWRGTYRNPSKILDFLASDVTVELDKPFPFQHSGDDQGWLDYLHLHVTAKSLHLVDLSRKKLTM